MKDAKTKGIDLDVGCGHNPKGTVNVERYLKASLHRSSNQHQLSDSSIEYYHVPNLILADAKALPFRDGQFNTVYCHHVIEHLTYPRTAIQELIRVSAKDIEIKVPTRYDNARSKPLHVSYVTYADFLKIAEENHLTLISMEYTKWKCWPHLWACWIRKPIELTVIFRVRNSDLER